MYCRVANSIVTIVGSVYLSQGQAKLMFMVTLITRPLAIAGVVIGLFSGGVIGVVIGSTIASYINSVISLRAAGKLIDLSLYSLLGPLFKTLLLATIMGICVYYFGIYVPLKNELYVFVSQLFLGALIYLALIFLFRPPAFDDLLELIVERIRNRKAKDKIGS